jgi:hypothetical protein
VARARGARAANTAPVIRASYLCMCIQMTWHNWLLALGPYVCSRDCGAMAARITLAGYYSSTCPGFTMNTQDTCRRHNNVVRRLPALFSSSSPFTHPASCASSPGATPSYCVLPGACTITGKEPRPAAVTALLAASLSSPLG